MLQNPIHTTMSHNLGLGPTAESRWRRFLKARLLAGVLFFLIEGHALCFDLSRRNALGPAHGVAGVPQTDRLRLPSAKAHGLSESRWGI